MAISFGPEISFEELNKKSERETKKKEDVGFFESALAGVVTGLWNIPKGFVSLGAEIFDVVGDTNTAKDVEEWFDNVNPFDDEAEARTVGKITTALASVGPLAVVGAGLGARAGKKIAENLAKRALAAKQGDKYLKLAKIGEKIIGPKSGTIIGSGVGEAVVADEDIGTFADITKGTSLEPFAITMMNRETTEGRAEAFRRLQNRLKFGTEGALFNLALIGVGKGIQQLRTPLEKGLTEFSDQSFIRNLEKYGIYGNKPEGGATKQVFESKRFSFDQIRSVERAASLAAKDLDTTVKEIGKSLNDNYLIARKGYDQSKKAQEIFLEDLYDVLRPRDEGSISLLDKTAKTKAIKDLERFIQKKNLDQGIEKIKFQLEDLNVKRSNNEILEPDFLKQRNLLNREKTSFEKSLKNLDMSEEEFRSLLTKNKRGFFQQKDYKSSPQFQRILKKVQEAGGDQEALEKSIIGFRTAVDNMSARLLQKTLPPEQAKVIKENLGKYLNSQYYLYELSSPLKKYKPTKQQIDKAINSVEESKIKAFIKANDKSPNLNERNFLKQQSEDEVNAFLKTKSIDEAEILNKKQNLETYKKRLTPAEIDAVNIKDSILKKKVLEPWQEELAGLIKDPSYSFFTTVSKQAHFNYTTDYLEKISKIGSRGPGKFVFNADEVPVGGKTNLNQFKEVQSKTIPGLSPLDGKYIRTPFYNEIFDTSNNWLNRSGVGTFYKYAVLLPKAGSQISKTILSPLTHVRNLLSAGAFVAANGAFFPNYGDISLLLPEALGGKGVFKQAYDLTGKRILGTMTKADDALYDRLLKVGVADSAVQPGETKRILRDIFKNPAEADRKVFTDSMDSIPKKLLRAYGKAEDAYVAEDDFWKIINWSLERNRYDKLLNNLNVNKSNFRKILTEKSTKGEYLRKLIQRDDYALESFSNFLDEIAGNLTRNQVPNYGYVGRTARALRQSPFGNFIAFPLEILRTGNNIFTRSIDDIVAGVGKGDILNPEIPEVLQLGLKRLFSFGLTVGGTPYALTQAFKSKNDVSDEEMTALRRMVPEWSRNSTLLPVGRNEKGYLKYVDFSYSNAYDTLTRPFTSIVRELSEGQVTKDSLMKSLGTGMADSLYEIVEPFASESIYTEALLDSTIRRGIGRGGRRVWQEQDDGGVKLAKAVGHIAESLKPGSIAQFKRIQEAVQGKADKKYGGTFKLEDELPGLIGFRRVQLDPEKAMTYMTTRFSSNLKKADNLFTAPLLRGGRVSPQEIISAYAYSEQRRFSILKEMYQDIDAARTLGMSNNKIRNELKGRRGLKRDLINDLVKGRYEPKEPSDFFKNRIRQINARLNREEGVDLPNPFGVAAPVIRRIINENRRINLLEEDLKVPEFLIQDNRAVFPQEIQTPTLTTPASINNNLITRPQQVSTRSGYDVNLSTAERDRFIEEFLNR